MKWALQPGSIMTTNATSTERKRKQYYRVVNGFYAVGIVSLLLGLFLGFELIGSVGYLLGIVGGATSGVYLKWTTSVTIVDERDERLVQRGSYLTIVIFAGVALAVFPVLFVLASAGYYEFTPVVEGVLYAVSALGLLWGACCLAVKHVL